MKLKHSSLEDQTRFVVFTLNFINPKFNNEQEEQIAQNVLYDFANHCNLTLPEMMEAIKMASKYSLSISVNGKSETIRLFREIDRLKLDEIEQGYIEYRKNDFAFEKGFKSVREEINKKALPPMQEKSPEEKEAEIWAFLADLKEKKQVPTLCVWIYDFLEKNSKKMTEFLNNLPEEEKRKMRKEVAFTLAKELATPDKRHYKIYKKAVFDFKNGINEHQEPIKSVKKEIAVKWWVIGDSE